MKRRQFWITSMLVCTSQIINGQSFEIPVYFEDSVGNRDTIILGYDDLASYGIDKGFGEIDIIDSAYSEVFEVRAAIYDYGAEWGVLPRIIESKKMIIGYICYNPTYFDEANSIMVVIKSDNWPITISWNQDAFMELCNHLDIIDCTPGGWFDVCGGGHPNLILKMHHIDTATYYDSEFKIPVDGDTLSALFFRFYNDFGSGVVDAPTMKEIIPYPNPFEGQVQMNYSFKADDKIFISNLYGKLIPFKLTDHGIDLMGASPGLYILTIQSRTGGSVTMKILKKSS